MNMRSTITDIATHTVVLIMPILNRPVMSNNAEMTTNNIEKTNRVSFLLLTVHSFISYLRFNNSLFCKMESVLFF